MDTADYKYLFIVVFSKRDVDTERGNGSVESERKYYLDVGGENSDSHGNGSTHLFFYRIRFGT